jgi:hypothetical protein
MAKTYNTPTVASLGKAEILTQASGQNGPKHESGLNSTSARMLDL